MEGLTPRSIVAELDKYIVGQVNAKKAVAIALRNRLRRKKLAPELQEEIVPKNIIMIGPTGVGKTEIARRLARLVNAPFVKVEASKFTEVGYVGRDVESMIRDLVETSIRMVRQEKMGLVEEKAAAAAEERLINILAPLPSHKSANVNPLEMFFGGNRDDAENKSELDERFNQAQLTQAQVQEQLRRGELENITVEIDVEDNSMPTVEVFSGAGMEEMGLNIQDMLGGLFPKKKKRRKMTVCEARRILTQEEAQKLIDMDEVVAEAINRAEQSGIIFLDEIDKIAAKESGTGPDVSRGGVQRDILPIVEGSTVVTKYGPVKTDFILFIAAGAFHVAKPSDMIPELQGRFPIRVELESLTEDDFKQILIEPRNSLIKQYTALLGTEGIFVEFTENSLDELAKIAYTVNEQTENIGARRLHTILEKLLEDIAFNAPECDEKHIKIDAQYVKEKLKDIVKDQDLSRYIL